MGVRKTRGEKAAVAWMEDTDLDDSSSNMNLDEKLHFKNIRERNWKNLKWPKCAV